VGGRSVRRVFESVEVVQQFKIRRKERQIELQIQKEAKFLVPKSIVGSLCGFFNYMLKMW